MKGIYSPVIDIRRKVFTEVARLAYEGGDYSRVDELPYKIYPGDGDGYRDSIFLERAVVGERWISVQWYQMVLMKVRYQKSIMIRRL